MLVSGDLSGSHIQVHLKMNLNGKEPLRFGKPRGANLDLGQEISPVMVVIMHRYDQKYRTVAQIYHIRHVLSSNFYDSIFLRG
jgi:hypothetical protein